MTTFIEEVKENIVRHTSTIVEQLDEDTVITNGLPDEQVDALAEALLNLVSERIIGREEWVDRALSSRARSKHTQTARNNLRRQQRTTLYEGTKKENV